MNLSNLPPGCTNADIERAATAGDEPEDLREAYEYMRRALCAISDHVKGNTTVRTQEFVEFLSVTGSQKDRLNDVYRIARHALSQYD